MRSEKPAGQMRLPSEGTQEQEASAQKVQVLGVLADLKNSIRTTPLQAGTIWNDKSRSRPASGSTGKQREYARYVSCSAE